MIRTAITMNTTQKITILPPPFVRRWTGTSDRTESMVRWLALEPSQNSGLVLSRWIGPDFWSGTSWCRLSGPDQILGPVLRLRMEPNSWLGYHSNGPVGNVVGSELLALSTFWVVLTFLNVFRMRYCSFSTTQPRYRASVNATERRLYALLPM